MKRDKSSFKRLEEKRFFVTIKEKRIDDHLIGNRFPFFINDFFTALLVRGLILGVHLMKSCLNFHPLLVLWHKENWRAANTVSGSPFSKAVWTDYRLEMTGKNEVIGLRGLLQQALENIENDSKINNIQTVTGGDINDAFFVETKRARYFVKYNATIPEGFFHSEANGLERLRKTGAIAVPHVYEVLEYKNEGILVMEWIDGDRNPRTEEELGRGLARLHSTKAQQFGLDDDTFIGTLPQPNGWYDRWIDYYRDRRLISQCKLAEKRKRMPSDRKAKLMKLCDTLDKWLPNDCDPSLLHGDLWGGNWIVGPNGQPYLIDPSVFYGHAEFEMAFTELFGGFSQAFYHSYEEIYPLSPEYKERKPLYQLYYLLVHLNLFGESYGASVDRILKRYVG